MREVFVISTHMIKFSKCLIGRDIPHVTVFDE